VFGFAHYSNGGYAYVINSTFAGFIFGLAFLEMGLLSAWILHFFWNFLVLFQMFFPKITGEKEKKKKKKEKKEKENK
jgi:membrane protease YdiL (CAAX protease family)